MNPPWLHCWRRGTKSAGAAPGQRSQGRPRPTAEWSRAARERMCEIWSATGVMRSVTASSDGAATQPTCCASPKHAYNLLRTKRHLWSRSNLLIEFALLILTLSGGAFRATLTSSVRSSRRSRLGRIRARSHVPDAGAQLPKLPDARAVLAPRSEHTIRTRARELGRRAN